MTFHWKILALACTLFIGGCSTATTKYPIGMTTGFPADARLYGTWKNMETQGDEPHNVYIHFLSSDGGAITALVVDTSGTGHDSWECSRLLTASLGSNNYLNIVEKGFCHGESKTEASRERYLYTIENGVLTIRMMDADKTIAAIKAGAIAGTYEHHVSKDRDGNVNYEYDTAEITADPAALDAYFATPEAAKLFTEFIMLKRVE